MAPRLPVEFMLWNDMKSCACLGEGESRQKDCHCWNVCVCVCFVCVCLTSVCDWQHNVFVVSSERRQAQSAHTKRTTSHTNRLVTLDLRMSPERHLTGVLTVR